MLCASKGEKKGIIKYVFYCLDLESSGFEAPIQRWLERLLSCLVSQLYIYIFSFPLTYFQNLIISTISFIHSYVRSLLQANTVVYKALGIQSWVRHTYIFQNYRPVNLHLRIIDLKYKEVSADIRYTKDTQKAQWWWRMGNRLDLEAVRAYFSRKWWG